MKLFTFLHLRIFSILLFINGLSAASLNIWQWGTKNLNPGLLNDNDNHHHQPLDNVIHNDNKDDHQDFTFRLYSHNIRYDNKYLWNGEHDWTKERKYLVSQSIRYNAQYNSIVSLQEVLHNQLDDILNLLGDDWTSFGVGRSDGKTNGEYSPILYKKSEWKLLDSKTFWLSETPDVPSRGWDAALERIVSWVYLENIKSGQKLNVFNTHLDHRGVIARRESVKLILQKAKGLNDDPSFFCGDFNTKPTDEPYSIVSKDLDDTSVASDKLNRYGHSDTFTGFDGNGDGDHETKIIDYIFVPKSGIKVETHSVLHSKFHDIYISDHRPVSADVTILN